MLLDLWGWVGDLKQGQATVLGLVGGFFTLVVGALINAGLNRRRDDRLRREDQRAVATALRAELEGLRRTLSDAAEAVSQEGYLKSDEQVNVPDLAQSIQIMPEVVSKFGLLDGTIISAVVDAYGMVEEYSAKLLLLGGRPGVTPDNFRRYVALPPDRLVPLVQLNNVTAEVIQEAIDQLGTIRRWREMSWPERWHWLRSTG
jgi:hypothetical protein